MKGIIVDTPGGPEQLHLGEVPMPEMGSEEVLVRVKATALNRADILQRQGRYPPPAGESALLGLEMAGMVEAVGPNGGPYRPGARVFGLLGGGGYAEFAAIHRDLVMPIPDRLSFEEAAAIPEVFLTAFQALHWYGALGPRKHVLIHAGASGVGTAAIQLVRAAGAHPYVTASARKHDVCRELGAELTIDYRTERFAARVKDHTDGYGADIVVDFIGAPYFKDNVDVLAADGRLILLATLGGSTVEAFDLRALFRKRGQFITSALRSRSLDYKARLTRDFAAYALPLFKNGTLRPVIDRVMDWSDVAEAHQVMEANENTGKIVLRVQ